MTGDHIGVETAGLRLFGEFLSLKSGKLTMSLDTGERIVLRLEDVKNVDGAWPQ